MPEPLIKNAPSTVNLSNSLFDSKLRQAIESEHDTLTAAVPLIVLGHLFQSAKLGGEFLFPKILRHHFTNLIDGYALAAFLNRGQMAYLSKRASPHAKPRPLTCALAAVALGGMVEADQARMPGRDFDKIDWACYALSSLAYLATNRNRIRPE